MLNVFSKEYLNILKRCINFNRKLEIKHLSTLNKNHTSIDKKQENRNEFRVFSKEEIERLPFSTPYFEHLEGNYLEAPLDVTTNSVSETPLLTKSNVGVGFLTLNSDYLGAASVGSLCRQLSDLEVNVYKRFDVLTSVNREVFSKGLDLFETSLFFESYSKLSKLMDSSKFSMKEESSGLQNSLIQNMEVIRKGLEDYVDNICDLLYIIKTYKKPLVVYGNGKMGGFGGNLCFMSNYSACYEHSSYQLNLNHKYFNNFGCSYVLSNLRGNLGEYLLLTNDEVVGEDLVFSGLVKRFIDPESISNMQIVSDRLVELPEKYVERHICDFTSKVTGENKFLKFWNILDYHFSHDNVNDIIDSIKKSYVNSNKFSIDKKRIEPSEVLEFESSILEKFQKNPIDSKRMQHLFDIVRRLKVMRYQILNELGIDAKEWNLMISYNYRPTLTIKEENMRMLYNMIMEVLLVESLGMEMELFYKYPYIDELDEDGNNKADKKHSIWRFRDKDASSINMDNTTDRSNKDKSSTMGVFERLSRDRYEYKIYDRNQMSLSTILGLKKLNVNYNPITKCEYDKTILGELEKRYRPDHLKETFQLMKNILNIDQ